LLAYLFVINPAMNVFGDRAMGTAEGVAEYFRLSYWHDVEFGVAWFIAALLLFSLGFAAWSARHPARPTRNTPLKGQDLFLAVIFITTASFVVRLVWPFLSTEKLGGLNLWEYPQMVAMFVLGVLATERGWLADGLSPRLRRGCGRIAVVSWVGVVILAVGITLVDEPDPFLGGMHLQALLIPVLEATIAVTMSLWAVDWFRRRWDQASAITHRAGRGSFAAYLIHAPITIVLAAALRHVGVPAELKFLAVYAMTVIVSFWLGWFVTRTQSGGRILSVVAAPEHLASAHVGVGRQP
jgi:hypothetical protein